MAPPNSTTCAATLHAALGLSRLMFVVDWNQNRMGMGLQPGARPLSLQRDNRAEPALVQVGAGPLLRTAVAHLADAASAASASPVTRYVVQSAIAIAPRDS